MRNKYLNERSTSMFIEQYNEGASLRDLRSLFKILPTECMDLVLILAQNRVIEPRIKRMPLSRLVTKEILKEFILDFNTGVPYTIIEKRFKIYSSTRKLIINKLVEQGKIKPRKGKTIITKELEHKIYYLLSDGTLTVNQIAEELEISISTVYSYSRRAKIGGYYEQ